VTLRHVHPEAPHSCCRFQKKNQFARQAHVQYKHKPQGAAAAYASAKGLTSANPVPQPGGGAAAAAPAISATGQLVGQGGGKKKTKKKCQHNREKRRCRECGGSQICPHNRRRNVCKDCMSNQGTGKSGAEQSAQGICVFSVCSLCVSTSTSPYKAPLTHRNMPASQQMEHRQPLQEQAHQKRERMNPLHRIPRHRLHRNRHRPRRGRHLPPRQVWQYIRNTLGTH
jgi:hypothetical protein